MRQTILHLMETGGPGGAERMLVSLVGRLDPSRYRSIVCLPRAGWLRSELDKHRIETIVLPQRGVLDARWLRAMLRLIKQHRVRLIHAHEFAMNTYGTLLSILAGTRIVGTVHGKNYYPDRWRRRLAYRWIARKAAIVAVSNDLKQFLQERIGIDPRHMLTLYNGIDSAAFHSDSGSGKRVRAELGAADQPVIGTIGNLYPVKGQRYFLEAAALVTQVHPEARFAVVGRGDLLPSLQRIAVGLGIDRNVSFLGFREDIPRLLDAMTVFVLPSISEGLPLSLLEAMSAAKPVVATAVGGIPEVVVDGESGFLVPPADARALADKILLLLNDAQLGARVGHAARRRIEQQFSVGTMVRRYEELYALGPGEHPWN